MRRLWGVCAWEREREGEKERHSTMRAKERKRQIPGFKVVVTHIL